MSTRLQTLTKGTQISQDNDIDRVKSVSDAIAAAQRMLKEVANRTLRYQPRLTGEITIAISFRDGVPFRVREATDSSQYFTPALKPDK